MPFLPASGIRWCSQPSCDARVRSSEATVAKSLEGHYRLEHIFSLRQSLEAFRYYQGLITETDEEIKRQLGELTTANTALPNPPQRTKACRYQRQGNEPRNFDLRSELYRIFGVDLTNVPGISAVTAQTILCEIGTDVARFRNASAFVSWLGLCPEKRVSGGKVLSTKSRNVRSRVATALRSPPSRFIMLETIWGNSFGASHADLADRKRLLLLLTNLPHIFHLLNTREAYNQSVFHKMRREDSQNGRSAASQAGFATGLSDYSCGEW